MRQSDVPQQDAGRPVKWHPVWVYGINAHVQHPEALPGDFHATGDIEADYPALCRKLGAVPHPAFKIRRASRVVRRPSNGASSRRPSIISEMQDGTARSTAQSFEQSAHKVEDAFLVARSMMLDRISLHLLSLLMPLAHSLKVVIFSHCQLDLRMLGYLRAGLSQGCSIEALQVEWNPMELPLPSLEEAMEAQGAEPFTCRTFASDTSLTASAEQKPLGGQRGDPSSDQYELRERRRYQQQVQQALRVFLDWISCIFGGRAEALEVLEKRADAGELLGPTEFVDRMEGLLGSRLGVMEVFEAMDGPDYAASEGRISLGQLHKALTALPEEGGPWTAQEAAQPREASEEPPDPIGAAIAAFFDGHCALESLSLRACHIGSLAVRTMAATLAEGPWQLRCLNLWENFICDGSAGALAQALSEYRGLEYLGLGRNRISDTGLELLCKPFCMEIIEEAAAKVARERIKQAEAKQEAAAKAKAKAKPKGAAVVSEAGEGRRAPVSYPETLEEVLSEEEGKDSMWLLRRGSELKTLNLAENPIQQRRTVAALQPFGPESVELVLRGTPVAAKIMARPLSLASRKAVHNEGWLLRLV